MMVTLIRQFIIFLAGIAIFSYLSSGAIYASLGLASRSPQRFTIAQSSVGSLVLSDLNNDLLNQSVELSQEVRQALKESEKDDVGCVAPMINRPFTDLHHVRIAPFACFFTDNKTLIIQAKNLAILPDGETLPLEQLLKRNNIPEGVSFQFDLIAWHWTDTDYQSTVDEIISSEVKAKLQS